MGAFGGLDFKMNPISLDGAGFDFELFGFTWPDSSRDRGPVLFQDRYCRRGSCLSLASHLIRS